MHQMHHYLDSEHQPYHKTRPDGMGIWTIVEMAAGYRFDCKLVSMSKIKVVFAKQRASEQLKPLRGEHGRRRQTVEPGEQAKTCWV